MITFISIPTLALYGPVKNHPDWILSAGAHTGVLAGGDRTWLEQPEHMRPRSSPLARRVAIYNWTFLLGQGLTVLAVGFPVAAGEFSLA